MHTCSYVEVTFGAATEVYRTCILNMDPWQSEISRTSYCLSTVTAIRLSFVVTILTLCNLGKTSASFEHSNTQDNHKALPCGSCEIWPYTQFTMLFLSLLYYMIYGYLWGQEAICASCHACGCDGYTTD